MDIIEPSFDPTVFTKNRRRLLEHNVGQSLFDQVVMEADRRSLLSDDHFTVDGTLSQRARKHVEEIFGWIKTVGGFRRSRCRGLDRTGLQGTWWPRPTTWCEWPSCWSANKRRPGHPGCETSPRRIAPSRLRKGTMGR